jgi:SAM-dependent methyltransferase
MPPMKRIRRESSSFGDPDFDHEYIQKGFHDRGTQLKEAESVLRILRPEVPLRILDLACGIGTHAVEWAKHGHRVAGVDISETFIAHARNNAEREGVKVDFLVRDIKQLDYSAEFEVVTWIEKPDFHENMPEAIYRFLSPGGRFIGDIRNPEHPRIRFLAGSWRTWREENGVFHLERHDKDEEKGIMEDVWITIDPEREVIEEKSSANDIRCCASRSLQTAMEALPRAGFSDIELYTMEGPRFAGGEEPYWLWIVARKQEPTNPSP